MTEPFGFLLAFSGDHTGDIRFALSEGADALRWRVLRDSAGVLRGGSEPFLARAESGEIVCLASTAGGVVVWTTADLETWDGPRPLPAAPAGAHRDALLPAVAASSASAALGVDGPRAALLHAGGAVHTFRAEGGTLVQERDGALVKHGIAGGDAAIVFAGLGGRTWYLLAATPDGLRPYVTRNLAGGAWQPAGADGMPAGARRGGVVTVTEDEFKRLESHA
ncbi:glycoside hydrolase family protein [Catenuloplanes japonicus]|uniref:hypothetical protein n=1 Tax=Catenuloplanes japonicus TaxID=33876 RepID=UPI0005253B40|nr:hypothetical protein [Catenuloplanes japonicus]